jgi:hypothetical protein
VLGRYALVSLERTDRAHGGFSAAPRSKDVESMEVNLRRGTGMPKDLKIATAQFENRSGDKAFNLAAIEELSARAAQSDADVVAFHDCSVTGYSFARRLSKEQMWDLAEVIPSGESTAALTGIARRHGISVLAGLFERGVDGEVYKAHVSVDEEGLKAKYRKIHPVINPHIKPGNEYVVFELKGWKCGILICYDNNVIETRSPSLVGTGTARPGSPNCTATYKASSTVRNRRSRGCPVGTRRIGCRADTKSQVAVAKNSSRAIKMAPTHHSTENSSSRSMTSPTFSHVDVFATGPVTGNGLTVLSSWHPAPQRAP